MPRKGPITAAELIEELERDPEFRRRRAEREAELEAYAERARKEQAPLLADLRAVGLDLASVWDLVSTSDRYEDAVPVLLSHLDRPYGDRTIEGIVRALTTRFARGKASEKLLDRFARETNPSLRWVIGNALAVVAARRDTDRVLELLGDRRSGGSRSMLTHAVARLMGADAIPMLIRLLDDNDVAAQAVIALGKLKAAEARPAIERFLSHPDGWVRQQARNALKKIDRSAQNRTPTPRPTPR